MASLQFMAINNQEGADIFEPDSVELSWRLNALRAFIDDANCDNASERASSRV